MHPSAMEYGHWFFECYLTGREGLTIADIGSLDVNGSLRSVAPQNCRYIGLDFSEGPGVDALLDDPYRLPIDDGMVDAVVSSSCMEHSEFFWLLFLELLRITKPSGLIYLNVPSNGSFHRYPVDCWRFYPDSGMALARWGQKNGYPVTLMESFVGRQHRSPWNDFVAVFARDEAFAENYPSRIIEHAPKATNGRVYEALDTLRNHTRVQQDQEPRFDVARALRFGKKKLKRRLAQ